MNIQNNLKANKKEFGN